MRSVNLVGLSPGSRGHHQRRAAHTWRGKERGVTPVSATGENAVLTSKGKKETLKLGEPFSAPSSNSPGSAKSRSHQADVQGHHWANGIVNGRSIRFLVDTGATLVVIPAAFAKTAGIEYLKGHSMVQTANGAAPAVP